VLYKDDDERNIAPSLYSVRYKLTLCPWRCHRGALGLYAPLETTQLLKTVPKCTKTLDFHTQNFLNLEKRHKPLRRLLPWWEENSPPTPYPLSAPSTSSSWLQCCCLHAVQLLLISRLSVHHKHIHPVRTPFDAYWWWALYRFQTNTGRLW